MLQIPFSHCDNPPNHRKSRRCYEKIHGYHGRQSTKNRWILLAPTKKTCLEKGRSFAHFYTMGRVGSSFLALLNTTWLGSILALRSTSPFMPEAVHRWDTSDCI